MNSQHSIKSGSESLRQASMKWSPTSESLMRSSSLVSRKLQVGVPHDDLLSSHDLGYVLNHGYRSWGAQPWDFGMSPKGWSSSSN